MLNLIIENFKNNNGKQTSTKKRTRVTAVCEN